MPSRTMQAVVNPERAQGAVVRETPVPEIGPREVLIRVRAASICGTDLHIYTWGRWAQRRQMRQGSAPPFECQAKHFEFPVSSFDLS